MPTWRRGPPARNLLLWNPVTCWALLAAAGIRWLLVQSLFGYTGRTALLIHLCQALVKMTLFAGLLFCLVGSLLSSSWAEAPEAKSPCPYGTFSYTDGYVWFCFEFYGYSLPFEEAEAVCQQNRKGGHLASITNDEETRMVSGYVSRMNQDRAEVWIGLHRRQNSDLYYGWNWLDGSYFSYTNWLGGTPNNIGGRQLCVVLTPGSGFKNWDDGTCSYGRPFLCKWRVF